MPESVDTLRSFGPLGNGDGFAVPDTPCLLLDRARLGANARRFLDIANRHGVTLRPHLKTCKSVDVARVLTGGRDDAPVTVSTLAEAEYFAAAGFTDILYAVGMAPGKFERVARLTKDTGARVTLLTDNLVVADAARHFAARLGVAFEFLVEVDCGDGRGGVMPDSELLVQVARRLHEGDGTAVRGVMTHAGQSYDTNDPVTVARIADRERDAAVGAANRLREAGFDVDVVSVGSTPTVAFAESLAGVTEARCGVHAFFDLDQFGRGVCRWDDLALSVLATVIGHNRASGIVLVDAGGLALSKDTSARHFLPDAGYGYVCHAETMQRVGPLSVTAVNQEHGKIAVDDACRYDEMPVGSQVRIVPNHACFTAAAYPGYHVIDNGAPCAYWSRHNGW